MPPSPASATAPGAAPQPTDHGSNGIDAYHKPGWGRLTGPWTRWDILWIIGLAGLVRLINLWAMPDAPEAFFFPDSGGYFAGVAAWLTPGSLGAWLAGDLALSGVGIPGQDVLLTDIRMPGYIWILAALSALGLEAPGEIALAQALVDAGTCALIASLAALYHGAAGRLAGLFAALSPTLVIHSTLVLQDTLFLHPFAWSLLLAALSIQRRSVTLALLAGVALGTAFVIRAVIQYWILIAPFLLASAVLIRWRRIPAALVMAAALFAGSLLPASPVLIRNIVNFQTVYPTTQTGVHALYWLVPLVRMTESGRGFEAEAREIQEDVAAVVTERGIELEELNPHEIDRLFRDLAKERLLEEPLRRIAIAWTQGAVITLAAPATLSDGRVRSMERPSFFAITGSSALDRIKRYLFDPFGPFQQILLASAVISVAGLATFAVGGLTLLRRYPLAAAGVVLLIGYFLALGGPTSGPKYRMPMEPVLLATMGIGAHFLFTILQRFLKSAHENKKASTF